jgi:hypothetical protein
MLGFYSLIWNAAVGSTGRLQHCYEQALRRGLTPTEGEVAVEFTVNLAQPGAHDVRIMASDLPELRFEACVVDTFAAMPIPSRTSGSEVLIVNLPLRFHYEGTRASDRGP